MNTPEKSTKSKGLLLSILGALAAVFLFGAAVMALRSVTQPTGGTQLVGEAGSSSMPVKPSADQPPGAVIVDVPWNHLNHIDSFSMTDQSGKPFDTAQFSGERPYLVNFFFAGCPSICRDFNKQVASLNEQLKKENVSFVTITVDPERDSAEVLKRYAQDFGAESPRWAFLTDQKYKIKQVGEQMFRVEVIDIANHTDNILLVDKWGRYRDRFKWDEAYDMKRLVKVVKQVAAETEPPLDKIVNTRNALVGREPVDLSTVRWLREFHLYDSNEKPFFSRDLVGQVWISNFFFTSCPTICKKQTQYLSGLQSRLNERTQMVSITTDPVTDTFEVLRQYARENGADGERWKFLTGNENTIPRVANEFFGAAGREDHHSTDLFVVDRWGSVRGRFAWQDSEQEVQMLELIESLWKEERPPGKFEYITGGEEK